MALTWDDKIKLMALGREPNEEDAPYRPGPGDGKPPWPGYPKPYEPKLVDQSQFDSFMDRFKAGSSNPKSPSLNHHSPEAQKLILNTALRIKGV